MPPGEKNSCSEGKARVVVSLEAIGAHSIIVSRACPVEFDDAETLTLHRT